MKKFILTLDGGGVRGIVSARILHSLEVKLQKLFNDPTYRVRNHFSLISGTSTGGILSLLMSSLDFNMQRILQIYMEECSKIFQSSFIRRNIGILFHAKYCSKNFEHAAIRLFGNKKLSDCYNNCLIPSYDIHSCNPIFFTRDNAHKYDYYLKDIAIATSSAPTYFPPKKVYECNGAIAYECIDGGIFANNPSLCALIEASKMFPTCSLKDYVVVSLGTGMNDKVDMSSKFEKASKWGSISWILPLIDTMLNSNADLSHYQVQKIFESHHLNINPLNLSMDCNYYRFQPIFNMLKYSNLDLSLDNIDPFNMQQLLEATEDYIGEKGIQKALNRLAEDIFTNDSRK